MEDRLSDEQKALLLRCAREAILNAVNGELFEPVNLSDVPARLRESGVTFVTLTNNGELRGCVGALEANKPLIHDVQEHAVAAALQDYRFPPVILSEIPAIRIEISCLTAPVILDYENPVDLFNQIRPHVDGVIMRDGFRRATFLPQVWEKLPTIDIFLDSLCRKMGAEPDLWRHKIMEISVYQVEEFHE